MNDYLQRVEWLAELTEQVPMHMDNISYVDFIPSEWSPQNMGARVQVTEGIPHPKIIYLDENGEADGHWDFWYTRDGDSRFILKQAVNEAHVEAYGFSKFLELM